MKKPNFETFNQKWADMVIGKVNRKGIDGFLQFKVTEVEPGRLVCEMPITNEIITMIGNIHGGCISALCDHVLGIVMYPVMPEGYWAATTEFKINLMSPVSKGTCTATAEIVSMSRRLAVVSIQVENEDRLVAIAQGTCTIVAPKS